MCASVIHDTAGMKNSYTCVCLNIAWLAARRHSGQEGPSHQTELCWKFRAIFVLRGSSTPGAWRRGVFAPRCPRVVGARLRVRGCEVLLVASLGLGTHSRGGRGGAAGAGAERKGPDKPEGGS